LADSCFQPLLEGLQVVAQPDGANSGGRYRQAALLDLVGNANLAVRRLLEREGDHRLLDLRVGAVLEVRLLARDLRQRRFAAGLV